MAILEEPFPLWMHAIRHRDMRARCLSEACRKELGLHAVLIIGELQQQTPLFACSVASQRNIYAAPSPLLQADMLPGMKRETVNGL